MGLAAAREAGREARRAGAVKSPVSVGTHAYPLVASGDTDPGAGMVAGVAWRGGPGRPGLGLRVSAEPEGTWTPVHESGGLASASRRWGGEAGAGAGACAAGAGRERVCGGGSSGARGRQPGRWVLLVTEAVRGPDCDRSGCSRRGRRRRRRRPRGARDVAPGGAAAAGLGVLR